VRPERTRERRVVAIAGTLSIYFGSAGLACAELSEQTRASVWAVLAMAGGFVLLGMLFIFFCRRWWSR
jgi:hypothetical protein